MSVPLTPSADKNWITARWACLEESMARSSTVISLLLQSTTHCRYRVYTKFLLTYTAIYRGNRKVLPLGITALQTQSHFHLGTPYNFFTFMLFLWEGRAVEVLEIKKKKLLLATNNTLPTCPFSFYDIFTSIMSLAPVLLKGLRILSKNHLSNSLTFSNNF